MNDKIDKALESEFFLTLLLFNNNHFKISGQHTFSAMYIEDDYILSKHQKSLLGGCIKYIFEYLGYEEYTRTELNKANIRWGKLFRKEDANV